MTKTAKSKKGSARSLKKAAPRKAAQTKPAARGRSAASSKPEKKKKKTVKHPAKPGAKPKPQSQPQSKPKSKSKPTQAKVSPAPKSRVSEAAKKPLANAKTPLANAKTTVSKGVPKGAPKGTAKPSAKTTPPPASKGKSKPEQPKTDKAKSEKPKSEKPKPEKKEPKIKVSAKKAPAKKAPAKRGPIDLSTAKSVAAVAAASQADSSGYVIINGRRVRMISTKGLPAPKRTKAVVEKEVEKPEIQVSTIKTKLSKKELDEYRTLLLAKRRQIVGTISGLEDEALRSNGGNLSTMPLHMADIGTDTFDQDFTLGMAQAERQTLTEIDGALQRIENKTYGVCQLTGKPIPKARLEAKPWAKFSIEAAKLVERGVVPR